MMRKKKKGFDLSQNRQKVFTIRIYNRASQARSQWGTYLDMIRGKVNQIALYLWLLVQTNVCAESFFSIDERTKSRSNYPLIKMFLIGNLI